MEGISREAEVPLTIGSKAKGKEDSPAEYPCQIPNDDLLKLMRDQKKITNDQAQEKGMVSDILKNGSLRSQSKVLGVILIKLLRGFCQRERTFLFSEEDELELIMVKFLDGLRCILVFGLGHA